MDRENGQGEIIVYQAADGLTRVDVRFEGRYSMADAGTAG